MDLKLLFHLFSEFSKYPKHDENVAIIVFGKETKFLQYYSNNYALIKQSIGIYIHFLCYSNHMIMLKSLPIVVLKFRPFC